MPFLLHIDTALNNASVGFSDGEKILCCRTSTNQKNHASFVQPAIVEMVLEYQFSLQNIDAVSVAIGPGSYTGLRVGLASAKGLCHALQKPLIAVNTLPILALAALEQAKNQIDFIENDALICPMIDARRMEVFTAIYTQNLETILPPTAIVLSEETIANTFNLPILIFCGNGCEKAKNLLGSEKTLFLSKEHGIEHLALLANKKYQENDFENLAYAEPFYAKPFYSPVSTKTNI